MLLQVAPIQLMNQNVGVAAIAGSKIGRNFIIQRELRDRYSPLGSIVILDGNVRSTGSLSTPNVINVASFCVKSVRAAATVSVSFTKPQLLEQ
jgi:hypothetical protein